MYVLKDFDSEYVYLEAIFSSAKEAIDTLEDMQEQAHVVLCKLEPVEEVKISKEWKTTVTKVGDLH